VPSAVWAVGSGGFENASLSAKGLGRGSAFTADADDPSAIAYNTAGMTQLRGFQVSAGITGINLITDYNARAGNEDTRSASKLVFAPNTYITMEIPKLPLTVGFGMNAPFGLKDHYSSTHPFRYIGYKNEFVAAGYHIAGAVKLHPKLSVGGSATYYDAYLEQRAKINSTNITSSVISAFPALPDADVRLRADGHAWGWNLGAMWKLHDQHQIGFNYRSQIRLPLAGRIAVENLQGPVMLGIFGSSDFESGITTDIVLPPQYTLAYKYQVTPEWDVEVDFGWTRWSVFDQQSFDFEKPNAVLLGLTPINRGYNNTFSLSVGSDWDINQYVTLRAGYFFFQAPAPDGHSGPVIPDSHRNSLAVGLGLHYKSLTVDAVYQIELFASRDVESTDIGDNVGIIAEGEYTSFIQLFSFNVTYRFGPGGEEESEAPAS